MAPDSASRIRVARRSARSTPVTSNRDPSGDHLDGVLPTSSGVLSSRSAPVFNSLMVMVRFGRPPRPSLTEVYASFSPSGEYEGAMFDPANCVAMAFDV